jgi:glycosyltransferase involved in cell wall biosynthesis/lipopolysaccharide biosynthesis glycosyltransferase
MPECQCENAGWCDLFKKEMTYDPPNWQWCKSLSEDQRRDYFNKMESTVRVLKKAPDKKKADIVNFFDILPEKKSKYAVCVIPANDSAMELLDITRAGVKKYAEKCGADYIELSGDQNPNWPMSNKYRLNRVAKAYDKTLYLDCDIVVKDDAPNIFELTPDDKISAYDEYEIFKQRNDTAWIRNQQEHIFITTLDSFSDDIKEEYITNGEFITESMINGGVLVIPNALADYYKQPSSPYTKFWCFDQHLLTLELPEEKFNNLTYKFNCEYEGNDFWNFVNNSHFIHFNGLKNKPDLRKSLLNQFNLGDFTPISADLTVVIPCHNYARYLGECLQSVADSSKLPVRVIIIDDASDDDPQTVCMEYFLSHKFEYRRVEFRDVHQVRRFGLSLVETKYVLFLDADNTLNPGYLQHCVQRLERDRNAAFVFPMLLAFDGGAGFLHEINLAPNIVQWKDIEMRNLCDAACVHRTEVLRSSLALKGDISTTCMAQDWRMARTILRAGSWHGLKSEIPLNYRIHSDQMTTQPSKSVWIGSDLEHEIVTIIVAFSGRWDVWLKLKEWIVSQSWPAEQTRLMILNSTHSALSVADFGLEALKLSGIQIERIDAGRPLLADLDRRPSQLIGREVEAAVAGLYNRAIQMAFGEYIFFLEDDVIPLRPDAIKQLFQGMGALVAAVSGLYKHRYFENAVAFYLPFTGQLFPMTGVDFEKVGGTGFGCLLARRSLLLNYLLSGDDIRHPHYDVDVSVRVAKDGWEWWLDRTVKCDHLINVD